MCGALALLAGCGQVDSGHTGLRLSWGKVVSEPLGPGLWFYNPIGGSLVAYDCREQRVDLKMNAYTKDVQSAEFQIVVTFALDHSRRRAQIESGPRLLGSNPEVGRQGAADPRHRRRRPADAEPAAAEEAELKPPRENLA